MSRVRPLLFLLVAGALACAESAPGLAPPGLDGQPASLFFPAGLALSKDGSNLYVASSNFDRHYSDGTLVRLPVSAFDEAAKAPSRRLSALPSGVTVGLIDGFAGDLELNPAGDALYLTTRDNELLTRVPLDAQGGFACDDHAVGGCSAGAVDLGVEDMQDPFALAFASLTPPGGTTPEPFVVVSHESPVTTGLTTSMDAFVAFIPESVAHSQAQLPFSHGAFRVDVGTVGSDSLAFDAATRQLFVGGCYSRVDPQTVVTCQVDQSSPLTRTDPLRVVTPEGGSSTPVTQVALGPLTGGGNTDAVALSSDGARLYVATASPSTLQTIALPLPGGESTPALLASVPLADEPSKMIVLRRKPNDASGDLVVVTATTTNAVLVVDPNRGEVLAQLDPDSGIGKGPYALASEQTATGDRVFVSLFNGCGVEAIDVPSADPFDTSVVGTVGSCP